MDQQIRLGKLLKMKKITLYLVVNRLALLTIAFFLSGINKLYDFIIMFGSRWDCHSYFSIANNWYVPRGSPGDVFIVFPPLYPILLRLISDLGINIYLGGVIISNILFVIGMLILYKTIAGRWNKKIASMALVLISIFPTSYFFSTTYPESLFVLIFAASFYFAEKENYLLSSFLAGLAAITRPFGIMIFPPIILFMFKKNKLSLRNLITNGLIFALPIIYYLLINYFIYGDFFAFAGFLKNNWQKSFDFPWNGIISSWKRGLFTNDNFTYKYIVGYAEAATSTIAWIFVLVGINKWKKYLPYLSYLLLGTLFFTSTGFILSAPRYLLSIPPLFILISEIFSKKKFLFYLWIPISIFLLVEFVKLFSLGQWAF